MIVLHSAWLKRAVRSASFDKLEVNVTLEALIQDLVSDLNTLSEDGVSIVLEGDVDPAF